MLSQLTFCCQVNTFLRGGGFHGSININAVKSRTDSASININAARFRIWGPRQATIHWVLTPTSGVMPCDIADPQMCVWIGNSWKTQRKTYVLSKDSWKM